MPITKRGSWTRSLSSCCLPCCNHHFARWCSFPFSSLQSFPSFSSFFFDATSVFNAWQSCTTTLIPCSPYALTAVNYQQSASPLRASSQLHNLAVLLPASLLLHLKRCSPNSVLQLKRSNYPFSGAHQRWTCISYLVALHLNVKEDWRAQTPSQGIDY